MTLSRLLVELLDRGIQLWAAGDEVRFRAPRGAMTAELREKLRSHKARVVARLGRGHKYVLPSFAQQRLWVLHQLDPASAAYNAPAAWRLRGTLDLPALGASLIAIVRRHEALRTRFTTIDGRPCQVVAAVDRPSLPLVELGALPPASRRAEAERLIAAEGDRPFDLARGPLLRSTLLRLGAEEHLLLLTMHHVVCDGWSIEIFDRELAALYRALATGRPSPLPPLAGQYADFAVWQRRWLGGEVLAAQLAYWRRQLGRKPPLLELPTDRPRPAIRTYRGGTVALGLGATAAAALKRSGREAGAPLFVALLAVFMAQLFRLTGQRDVVVGAPVANRNRAEIEGLIGCFVNTLALRGDLAGDPSFRELLERIREVALGAYAHQDLPFERLVEELQPERDLGRNPLFQVVVVHHHAPSSEVKLPGLRMTPRELDMTRVRFDLELHFWEAGETLSGLLVYPTDLFDATTIARWARHFEHLAGEAAAHPDLRLQELPPATPAGRHQMLVEWNGGREERGGDGRCLHELFAAQAARTPETVAVVLPEGDRTLTYQEVDERANRLAHDLLRLGVGPEVRVGLCLERLPELIIGLLAILKAGGAYVPIEPSYPAARQAWILEDAGISVLLTQAELSGPLSVHAGTVICLDRVDPRPAADPGVRVDPANPAYVIYTSGSTGRPKGVEITHANVTRLFAATGERFRFGPGDVWTLFHSVAFDFSVWELWGALLHGGRLVVVPYLVSRSPEAFSRLLARQRVTVLNQTPSAFRTLIPAAARWRRELGMRWVIFGGEALDFASLRPWFDQHGEPQLVNMYGITETTVHTTCRPISAAEARGTSGSLIGRPLGDLAAYVVDERLRPLPPGAAGELCVGGAGLGRGYLDRPGLTAERFLPSPFGGPGGARLYRTGDRARLRADGELEYLGRVDDQVKIRGFRVEPGEIEKTLTAHPAVGQCVVAAREMAGTKRLVAYWVRESPHPGSGLRAFLRAKLPEYMVPAAFVELDALPLGPHGKVDRRALPEPEEGRTGLGESWVGPRNPVEEALAEIWCAVLGLDRVGMFDRFFDVGGDSILAIRLLARARQSGLELSLQQLFQYQTIDELARLAHPADARPALATRVLSLVAAADCRRLPAEVVDACPLTRLQAGMLFHSELRPEEAIYHDVFTTHLRAPFDLDAWRTAIARQVAMHPVLRTSFALSAFSEPLQLVHRRVELAVEVVDLARLGPGAQEAAVDQWMATERRRPFAWDRPPLLRFTLLPRGEESFQLGLTFHHAILDGWSVACLQTELFRHVMHLLEGAPRPVLRPPAVTLRDYVAVERAILDSAAARRYWREKLVGAHLASLPRRPRASRKKGPGDEIEVATSRDLSDRLRELAREEGVPLKSVLLAAHLRVMSLVAGHPDVVTGLVANCRLEATDGERTLGLFLNTLPFRLTLSGGSWRSLIRAAFRADLEALAFRRYPLAEIQALCGGQPLFETAFNFTHFHVYRALAEVPGLEMVGGKVFERTNFTLLANFGLDAVESRLGLTLQYDAGELDRAQVVRLAGYYRAALAAMARQPSGRHEAQALVSEAERHQLLREWNDTGPGATRGVTVVGWFEQQVAATPERSAVVCGPRHLSYRELDSRAGRLAAGLRRRGVGRGSLVGLCVERSPEMLVGVLGILKAGAAYVPLDPDFPPARLELMLAETRAVGQGAVVLSQESLRAKLEAAGAGSEAILLAAEESAVALTAAPGESPPGPDPLDLAYVIYTSGSTGRPKGIALSHLALSNLIAWHLDPSPAGGRLRPGASTLQFASLSFDASFHEIFATWCSGGCLHLVPEALRRDVAALVRYLSREPVEKAILPVVVLQRLAEECLAGEDPDLHLRELIATGEQLHLTPAVVRFFARHPTIALHNHYGPSETHVVTACPLPPAPRSWPSHPAIGRPIAGARILLLDRRLEPVPIGTSGELWVGGVALARGYLERPALTAARFVPDPFAREGGGRLYRTGDLARYRPDGVVVFLGRADQQVKIRGFRVELEEIEGLLTRHPGVRQAAVVARPTAGGGDHRLVACLVAAGEVPTVSELRRHLSAELPEYMVPSAFVSLDALPLGPTGKIDRSALPAPGTERPELEEGYVAPRTPIEQELVAIWSEVLGLERIGIRDDFFLLGGHSLDAVRLMARIGDRFGARPALAALLRHPTVEALAGLIRTPRPAASALPLVEIRAGHRRPPFFCVHPGGGNVLCYSDLARHLRQDRPFYGLQVPGHPFPGIGSMATNYLSTIRNRQPQGPYLVGGWSMGGVVAFEIARQLRIRGDEVALLALFDSAAPGAGAGGESRDPAPSLLHFARILGLAADELGKAQLAGLDRDEGLELIGERAGRGRLTADVDRAEIRHLYDLFAGNVRAMQEYSAQPYGGKITLFRPQRTLDPPSIPRPSQGQAAADAADPTLGWGALASAGVEVHTVPGDHFTMIREPHARVLAAKLDRCLRELEKSWQQTGN